MDTFLIVSLALVSLVMIGTGLSHRGGIFEYPFMAGATFLGFVVPSLPGLTHDPFLPPGAFTITVAFTIGCAAMVLFGWRLGARPIAWMQRPSLDEQRVLWAAVALSLLGAFFFHKLGELPGDIKYETMPTGLPTVYLFFGDTLTYGFAIALICYTHRPSKLAASIVLFDLMLLVSRVLISGKRGQTTEIALAILLAIWFRRNWAFPRIPALIAVLVATVSLSSAGNYRNLVRENHHRSAPSLSQLSEINVFGNFEHLLSDGGKEMRNAMYLIDYYENTQNFDFGLSHWNVIVWTFVPAQLLGSDFKNALMVDLGDDRNFQPDTGTTLTGMSDAFGSFWYFGVFVFFFIAYAMGRLYRTALSGSVLAQVIYILSVTASMLCITHYTEWIVDTWIKLFVFVVLPLLWGCQSRLGHMPARINLPFGRDRRILQRP